MNVNEYQMSTVSVFLSFFSLIFFLTNVPGYPSLFKFMDVLGGRRQALVFSLLLFWLHTVIFCANLSILFCNITKIK